MILSKDSNNNWTPTAGGTGTFIGTKAAFNAVKATLPVNTVAYITDDGNGDLQPVDAVTNGDMHPVTSNAVYDLIENCVGALNRDQMKESFPIVSNVNNAINPGFYIVTGPEGYGGVLVLGNHTNRLVSGNTWIWQIYFGTSGTLYSRNAINPSSLPPASSDWSAWKTITTN